MGIPIGFAMMWWSRALWWNSNIDPDDVGFMEPTETELEEEEENVEENTKDEKEKETPEPEPEKGAVEEYLPMFLQCIASIFLIVSLLMDDLSDTDMNKLNDGYMVDGVASSTFDKVTTTCGW